MKDYILSIDQGTTGTTALIIDANNLSIVAQVNEEFRQYYPKPGLVEHDLEDIWNTVKTTTLQALAKAEITANDIEAIGITNQRETTCAFKKSGQPLCNAIVWQDRRTLDFCSENKDRFAPLKKKTGLTLDPYFSGSKINWLLKNNDPVKEARKAQDLCFGTIDTFLLYRLTSGQSYCTEPTNASRTLLMDLKSARWDQQLLDFFSVSEHELPKIQDTFGHFGATSGLDFLPDGIPITCILGDQQAALFGQAGHQKGDLKITYGTGAFLLMNTGEELIHSQNGLLTTVAYRHQGKNFYALEGAVYIAGAAVQWLRDNLNIIESAKSIEAMAQKAYENLDSVEHILFLPFFSGIGSPHWSPEAKGAIVGLTRDTQNEQIAFACLEGIALSLSDLAKATISDSEINIDQIKVDGGAAANDLLLKLQSNILGINVIRPKVIETTGFGAAMGALLGIGKVSFKGIKDNWKEDKLFTPDTTRSSYTKKKVSLWNSYIKRLFF